MSELVRKLSPDTILGTDRKRPAEAVYLYRIAGRVSSFETGSTQYGEYTELIGDFQAMRFDTGESFVGNNCFLPAGIGELIASKLKQNPGAAIDFVYDVGLKPAKSTKPEDANKYEYIVSNPADDGKSNPLFQTMIKLPPPRGVKQLPSA